MEISSTILEFLVRPALFWLFGRGSARRVTEYSRSQVKLVQEEFDIIDASPVPEPNH